MRTPVMLALASTVAAVMSERASSQEDRGGGKGGQAILVRTVRLWQPVERASQLMLYGVLGGEGILTLDPNHCQLDQFGDDELCTEIAPVTRHVKITRLRTPDPLGRGRALYSIENAGLRGRLYLVVPPDPGKDAYRFVHEDGSSRRAITAERLVYEQVKLADPSGVEGINGLPILDLVPGGKKCDRIDFEDAQVIGGFVNDTYFLFVSGKKPNLNMKVRLLPRVYVQRPEYWGIDLVGCVEGDVSLPATGPYVVSLPLGGITGTKGVAVIGKTKGMKLDVPPKPKSGPDRDGKDR